MDSDLTTAKETKNKGLLFKNQMFYSFKKSQPPNPLTASPYLFAPLKNRWLELLIDING